MFDHTAKTAQLVITTVSGTVYALNLTSSTLVRVAREPGVTTPNGVLAFTSFEVDEDKRLVVRRDGDLLIRSSRIVAMYSY